MCGIAGIAVHQGPPVRREDLTVLARGLAHRGPDGEGFWVSADERVGLVHRRLAILDTSEAGHQPMLSADRTTTIVYNGEIFNFLELRDELVKRGHTFRGDSDTEVVLAAWREWREDMLPRFNGMWALAIHDSTTGELFLARDRFGIKPLLYTTGDRRMAFASEQRALLQVVTERHLDAPVVERLLFDPFAVEGSSRTIHKEVHRLPAGHSALWRNGRLSVRRWWRTTDHLVEPPRTARAQADRFHELFTDSIRLRMRSDVTIGTCLSGGFDSSAIVCEMKEVARQEGQRRREAGDWRHAFIASFPGRAHDETPQALEAARHAGVTPHVIDLSQTEDPSMIDCILRDLDDIYISLPAAPWQIYRRLRERGTLVSLDGHGADELMGGYRQGGEGVGFAVRNALARAAGASKAASHRLDDAKLAWLSARGLSFLRRSSIRAPRALEIPAELDALPAEWGMFNRRLYRMFHSTVLPTILRNFDRLSMAHGVEVRMPFMDWRLVCYVMSLPDAAKIDPIGSKAIARHAMQGRMPESIRVSQRKVGFNSPMPEWLNGSLGQWMSALLAKPHPQFDDMVDRGALLRRVNSLNGNRAWNWERASRLWPYANLRWLLDQ
ncbi:asparagine synthase (glutamine-hydrolysing) [Panacagrimonas perspica]|uniref:asparagine synthase (glutamine-hydrolyzing) n=1 Tax=Panacagrimonas perspica TaxID=381431 RepID=A0A4V3URX2_9GAMM|nr:asparagine synthase (glutamine-hydrolyzing) [Panacagrimonas perspica]TDU24133.1 asparagine synthase (glutamine-hydrolysing) [Panacagrimonas perspica]THD04551.1 asparagine synthase (glutamine-hydrolyzing) [Panacagrimonas perspica]